MNRKLCSACKAEIDSAATRCPHCRARQAEAPPMHRDMPGRMLGGVCAALAAELGVDPTLVRVGFAIAAALSGGLAIGVYVLIWVLTPFGPQDRSPASRVLDWVDRLVGSSAQPRRDAEEGPPRPS
jgi:phage shock protein PspC (stress-responsive transcriptional regulator)